MQLVTLDVVDMLMPIVHVHHDSNGTQKVQNPRPLC